MDPSLNSREYDSDFSGVKARARASSGRRSRKSSTSSSLVRVLIEDKLDAERLAAELTRANELLRIESRRAHDAERVAREAQEFLKGVEHARLAAQQETARVKAELRLYTVQYENAQSQLVRANEMIREADAEREEAVEAMKKMRKRIEKYREAELERRAREVGRKEGRKEVLIERGVLREDEDEDEEQAPLADDGIIQPTPIQASPREPPPMPVTTPGPVSIPIESPPARRVPDHIIVRSPAALPIPPPDIDLASRFPPPDRPPSRAATLNYPPYQAMHTGHVRNYSVPDANGFGPPSSSSSDSADDYRYGVPVRPLSRNVADAIATMGQRDRDLGNRTPGGLGLSGVPSVRTRTPGPYQSQTPGHRMSLISEPEIIVPRPPSQPSTPSQPIALAPSFDSYTRPNINSITPTNSSSSTDSTTTSTSSTDTLTGQEPQVAQTPRIATLRRESSESAGSGRRYSSGSSVPGIIIEPPSRPESTGTVMTTATVPIFIENPRTPGPMSPGVVPSSFPPFDAQPMPNTPGPSSARRASFAGSEVIPDGFARGGHSVSGEQPPPGFMGAASPIYDGGQRTPSLRHVPSHSRSQSRASIASTHRTRPPPPTIPEEGFPSEGSAVEYFQQRDPAGGYFDPAAAAGGRGSPSMSTISARRVPLPPGSSIGEESRPASRASRTYGHTPYRRPTSGLYE